MTLRLMLFEWRNLCGDRTPLLIALLLGLSIVYGAANGSRWVWFQRETIAAAVGEEHERLAGIRNDIPKLDAGEKKVTPFTDPRLPQYFGRSLGVKLAAMPPAATGALSIGQSDLYPYYFKISTNSKETFANNDEIENPVHLLAGRFDLAFVIVYLLPLMILAFSYNLVSAEKEAGTLALTLSQPVTLSRVVLAKAGLRALFILALATLVPLAGVVAGGVDVAAEGVLPRLLLWIVVTGVYGLFWFGLAIVVNAAGKSSATNAIVLASAWLLIVLLIPAILNLAVNSAYPVPSRVEMIQAIRTAGDEATRQGSQVLARYLEDHPELAPARGGDSAPDFATLLIAVNDATERKVRPVLEDFERQVASRQAMVDDLRYVSPAITAQLAFNDLAGSSSQRYRHFLSQVDDYHLRWREFFVPRIMARQKIAVADLDRLPAFEFREEETGAVARRVQAGVLGILLPGLALLVPALQRLRRYRVAG